MIRKPSVECPDYLRSENNPVYFIAEIGGNHDGSFEKAQEQLSLAVEANVDAVKFQAYRGDRLVSTEENRSRSEHYKKRELTRCEFERLAEICSENNVDFSLSIWDEQILSWANELVPFHKIGSGDLTAFPLIRKMVATGKPILLSTGLSNLDEISRTVKFIEGLDPSYTKHNKLVLLQCTSSYPTPDGDANLAVIPTLENEFDLPIGYSDHTLGTEAGYLAALGGACVIEMHFTDKRQNRTYRDHKLSVKKREVVEMMDKINKAKELLGDGDKKITPSELESGQETSFRRSIYAKKDLRPNKTITESDLTVLRPEHGIPAWKFQDIIGRKLVRPRKKHKPIRESDIE